MECSVLSEGGGVDFEAVFGDYESVGDALSACNVFVKEGRYGFAVGPHDCAGL